MAGDGVVAGAADAGAVSAGEAAPDAERFRGLHVCAELTDNALFHACGNGLGPSFAGRLVMRFSEPRAGGMPNKRTRKSEVCGFLQQDAVDALVAFANIAERAAPYAWAADPVPEAPERGWLGDAGKGRSVLVAEAGRFADRFGLPHMGADGTGPETRNTPLRRGTLRFTGSYEDEFRASARRMREVLSSPGSAFSRNMYRRSLEERGLYVEGDAAATEARIFVDGMAPFAKDFSGISDYRKQRAAIVAERDGLEARMRDARPDAAETGEVDNRIARLHLDEGMLSLACERAFRRFDDAGRRSLSEDGYVLPDVDAMYGVGLLFRDAIELFAAIGGDDAAFARVLTKAHMELFDVAGAVGDPEGGGADPAVAAAEGRYTLWFESCGSDPANPGSNMSRHEYVADVAGTRLRLRRRESDWRDEERYGCGRAVHVLCGPGETPRAFEGLVRKHLPDFLDGLIREGVELNYRGLFAEPAPIDSKRPAVTVNDFGSDLVRTLWTVMDLVSKGEIPLRIARCKCCGRLMNTAREAGHAREFCDSSCRSLHRKRVAAQEKSGKENEDARVRREFLEYMESGRGIHVGMTSHMGPEMQPDPEPEREGVLESILRRITG
ncbi:MAG: hypothetical protein IJ111_10825 [Eggerthellaceae bacterium]|nr:hypothetical protein [Eggerthellaceae bacterium]